MAAQRELVGEMPATVGFVVAGLALTAALLDVRGSFAGLGVGWVGGAIAAATVVAFALRRHGVLGRIAALVALVGSVLLAAYATAVLVEPLVGGGTAPAVAPTLPAVIGLALLAAGVAYADWRGVGGEAFLDRLRTGLYAFAVGLGGFVAGVALNVVAAGSLGQSLPETWRFAAANAAFYVGLLAVTLYFLRVSGRGVDYLDVSMPDRRDVAYGVGATVLIFGLLFAFAALARAVGVQGSRSSIEELARANPEILLVLIPAAYLLIGPGEELLYRNVVQKYLAEAYSPAGAVVVGTAVFTLVHVPTYFTAGPAEVVVRLFQLFGLSLVLAVTYERTRNVVVVSVVHGTFDAVQFALLYAYLTGGG